MGILRLLLALTVVVTHSAPIFGWEGVGGSMAVQAFYIISGFYMALILHEKYNKVENSYKLFITNRLLRLYLIFWVVLLLTFIACVLSYYLAGDPLRLQSYISYVQYMSWPSLLALVCTNVALIGQDAVMFAGLNITTGSLFFTPNFQLTSPQLHEFLLIPQAWTIGVEIAFYLIAPFLVRRKAWVLGILLLGSLLLRVWIYSMGMAHDPWTYRFFPTELALFLAGILSYRWYRVLQKYPITSRQTGIAFIGILLLTFLYQYLPIVSIYKKTAYYGIIAFVLPLLFMHTRSNKRDLAIGEFSYPVYISHYIIIQLLLLFSNRFHISLETQRSLIGITSILFTILFSMLLLRYVANPIERIRQKRIKKAMSASPVNRSIPESVNLAGTPSMQDQ